MTDGLDFLHNELKALRTIIERLVNNSDQLTQVSRLERELVDAKWEKATLGALVSLLPNLEAVLERTVTWGPMFLSAEVVYLVEVAESGNGNKALKLAFHSDRSVYSPNEADIPEGTFIGRAVRTKTSTTVGAGEEGAFKVPSDPCTFKNAVAVPMIGLGGEVLGAIVWQNRLPSGTFRDQIDMNRLNDFVRVAGNAFELGSLVRRIQYLADYDQMTDLIRRDRLVEFVNGLVISHKFGPWMHFAIIDLDGFKTVNDTLGHTAGDQLIKACAASLKDKACGDNVVCSHWGGDEFAFGLVSYSKEEGKQFADETRTGLAAKAKEWVEQNGLTSCNLTASVGGCSIKRGEDSTYDRMVSEADTQLANAKQQGKNQVKWVFVD